MAHIIKVAVGFFITTIIVGSVCFASGGFKGNYVGKLLVSSSEDLGGIKDKCDTEVLVEATDAKVTVTRNAKKCDKYALQQKKSVFDFTISGEKIISQGKEVGTLKDGKLLANIDLATVMIYAVEVDNIGSKTITYSEKIYQQGFTSPELMVSVEGEMTLK